MDSDPCSMCLKPLVSSQPLGAFFGCGHCLHVKCHTMLQQSWAEQDPNKTKLCPQCRAPAISFRRIYLSGRDSDYIGVGDIPNCSLHKPDICIENAGVQKVNGTYHVHQIHSGILQYIKFGSHLRADVIYIHQKVNSEGSKYWFVTAVSNGDYLGSSINKHYYKVQLDSLASSSPPSTGWGLAEESNASRFRQAPTLNYCIGGKRRPPSSAETKPTARKRGKR